MAGAMQKGIVFKNLAEKIVRFFSKFSKGLQKDLTAKIETLKIEVLEDYDRVFVVEEEVDPRRDKLRQELLQLNAEAQAELSGPIREKLRQALQASTDASIQDVKGYFDEIDIVQFQPKIATTTQTKQTRDDSAEEMDEGESSDTSSGS